MSEVLNEKVTSSEEGGFSRRRVVKGVAWTVPVLVTAIAVPPASASPGTISATATWVGGAAIQYSKVGGGSPTFGGTGPVRLDIKNTGTSPFTGTISVAIILEPVGSVLVGIGVESLLPATVSSRSAFTPQHRSEATFSYTGPIAVNETKNFSVLFHYESITPRPNKVTYSYVMTTSVVMTAGSSSLSLAPSTSNPTIAF